MKSFVVRIVSILLVVMALVSYNAVLESRSKNEEIARLEAELESNELVMASLADSREETESVSETGLTDGTYTGEAEGFGGNIQVEVIIQSGQLTDINIVSADGEDGAYLGMAQDIIPEIIEKQSAEVDTISGATFSSTGIKNAVAQALEKAGN